MFTVWGYSPLLTYYVRFVGLFSSYSVLCPLCEVIHLFFSSMSTMWGSSPFIRYYDHFVRLFASFSVLWSLCEVIHLLFGSVFVLWGCSPLFQYYDRHLWFFAFSSVRCPLYGILCILFGAVTSIWGGYWPAYSCCGPGVVSCNFRVRVHVPVVWAPELPGSFECIASMCAFLGAMLFVVSGLLAVALVPVFCTCFCFSCWEFPYLPW